MKKSVHQSYVESSRDLDRFRSSNLATSLRTSSKPDQTSYDSHNASYLSSNPSPNQKHSYLSKDQPSSSTYSPSYATTTAISSSAFYDKLNQHIHEDRNLSERLSYDNDYISPRRSLRQSDMDYHTISRKSTSNMVTSFHALQLKLKTLEQQRLSTIDEKDELKHKIHHIKRELALWKNKNEYHITDNLLSSKSMMDRSRVEYDGLASKIRSQEDIHRSVQNSITAQEAMIKSLTHDVNHDTKSRIQSLERRKNMLQDELNVIDKRNKTLQKNLDEIISDDHNVLKSSIKKLESEIEEVSGTNERSKLKTDSLSRYMEFIIKMNNDLCDTLVTREQSKVNILRLAEKYTPPRYAWPKREGDGHDYDAIAEMVNATATAAAIEKKLRRSSYDSKGDDFNPMMIRRSTSRRKLMSSSHNGRIGMLERRAASAIAQATAAARVRSYHHPGHNRILSTSSQPRPRSASSSRSHHKDAFIPTSPNRESKEFNRVAVDSTVYGRRKSLR